MNPNSQLRLPLSLYWFIPFAFIFLIQVFPRLGMESPAGDEPVDLADGFYYWKGDVLSDSRHPPLAKALQALPLDWLGMESRTPDSITNYERRDYNFLFVVNHGKFEAAFNAARWVSLLFGLGLGCLLFFALRPFPRPVSFFALVLWALEPNLLAFSGLVLADVPLTFFYFLAIFSFQKLKEGIGGWKKAVQTGVLTGMAVTVKFSAVVLIAVFFLLEGLDLLKESAKTRKRILFQVGTHWLWGMAGALLFISILYLPGTLKLPDHAFPLSYFWDGFTSMAGFSGHPTFFRGQLSTQNHWSYFPLAFLLKSTLPFLAFLGLSVYLALSGRIKIPFWYWLPGLVFLGAVIPFHNIGIREILPIYPFFILTASVGAGWLWEQSPKGLKLLPKILTGGLLLFQAASLILHFPGQISYFNELIPPERRLYWLGDSNLDIGQDTKRLASFAQQKKWDRVKLAYFGNVDPELYGLRWNYWTKKDLEGPQPGWVYAVNTAFLQLGPAFLPGAEAINQSWITERPPTGMIGDTWYYFEIPPGPAVLDASPLLSSALPYRAYERLDTNPKR